MSGRCMSPRRSPMKDCRKFYINGSWVAPKTARDHQVINPPTEEPSGTTPPAGKADGAHAAEAPRRPSLTSSHTTREQRLALRQSIMTPYQPHRHERAEPL